MGRPKSTLKTAFIQSRIDAALVKQVREIVDQSPGATVSDFVHDAINLHLQRRKHVKAKTVDSSGEMDVNAALMHAIQAMQKTLSSIDGTAKKTESWSVLIAKEMGVQL